MYKNIIFDVGNVLLSYDWRGALHKAGVKEEYLDELGPMLLDDPFWEELDLGIRPYFDVVNDLCDKYKEHSDGVRNFLTNVENMPIDRPKIWDEVKKLKDNGYKLYILSNYSEYMFNIHAGSKPFMKYMDGMIVSYMVHVGKPEPKIYEALVDKYNLNPKESLFFDDRSENVEGAIEYGIDAKCVTSEDFLLAELIKLNAKKA